MRLVPRQLQRSGMTGRVPYYGGRITPTVAYGIDHPDAPVQTQWNPAYSMGRPAPAAPPPPVAGAPATPDRATTLAQLDALLSSGAITREEHDAIAARVTS